MKYQKICNFKSLCGKALILIMAVLSYTYGSGFEESEDRCLNGRFPGYARMSSQAIVTPVPQALVSFPEERTHAQSVIDGVVGMFQQDVPGLKVPKYNIIVGGLNKGVNASYHQALKQFKFPHAIVGTKYIRTAFDQGIVSHEGGHMILFCLIQMGRTSHTDAIHEFFGDATRYFYECYNPKTRQKFVKNLDENQGCVGNTPFTCIRNNNHLVALEDVFHDLKLCEAHDFSMVMSTAIFENMSQAYRNLKSSNYMQNLTIAQNIVDWHRITLVGAILTLNTPSPTLMDLATCMLKVSHRDAPFRNELGWQFKERGLISVVHRSLVRGVDGYIRKVERVSANQSFATLCLK